MSLRVSIAMAGVSLLICSGAAQTTEPVANAARKRLAVLPFEYGAVQKDLEGWDIGKGIADLIITELLKSPRFQLVERTRLDVVIGEGEIGKRKDDKQSGTGSLHQIIPADAILLGSVTQFGAERREKGLWGLGWPGGGGIGKQKGIAKVVLNARITNPRTSELIAAVTGTGESTRSGFMLGALGGKAGKFGGGGISMTSNDFRETILGEATYAAVNNLVTELIKADDKIPYQRRELRGLVLDVAGAEITVDLGSDQGVRVGNVLKVVNVVREIRDSKGGDRPGGDRGRGDAEG